MEALKIEGLCKRYAKKGEYTVENVGFCCRAGEIVGLLGHNGAGKSTTLRCLEGMLPFERGKIEICGFDIVREPIKAKAQMGFVTDDHAVFEKLTGRQYLRFMADVYKVPSGVRRERTDALEEVFRLGDAANRLIGSYSHGMKQKICMMGSLLHRPRLWVLDEPMTGLDPRTARAVQTFMREYAREGGSVLFSSHDLATAEKLCDRVVLIRRGRQIEDIDLNEREEGFCLEEVFFQND